MASWARATARGGVGPGDAASLGGVIAVGDPAAGGSGSTNPAVFNLSGGTVQAGVWARAAAWKSAPMAAPAS